MRLVPPRAPRTRPRGRPRGRPPRARTIDNQSTVAASTQTSLTDDSSSEGAGENPPPINSRYQLRRNRVPRYPCATCGLPQLRLCQQDREDPGTSDMARGEKLLQATAS